jgi:hypothetical protein
MTELTQAELAELNNYDYAAHVTALEPYTELVARNRVTGKEVIGVISNDGIALRIDVRTLGDSDWEAVENGEATIRPVVLS